MTQNTEKGGPTPVFPDAGTGRTAGSDLHERLTLAIENALELLEKGDVLLAKGYLEVALDLLAEGER